MGLFKLERGTIDALGAVISSCICWLLDEVMPLSALVHYMA